MRLVGSVFRWKGGAEHTLAVRPFRQGCHYCGTSGAVALAKLVRRRRLAKCLQRVSCRGCQHEAFEPRQSVAAQLTLCAFEVLGGDRTKCNARAQSEREDKGPHLSGWCAGERAQGR